MQVLLNSSTRQNGFVRVILWFIGSFAVSGVVTVLMFSHSIWLFLWPSGCPEIEKVVP